jgi:hypothetical protein
MKRYTLKELEEILAIHGVHKCEVCGEYERPRTGLGGTQPDHLGRDTKGRRVHQYCAQK